MDRKTAEGLMAVATRKAMLSRLDEAIALGKKTRLNKNSGQESLFADEDESGHEERNRKMANEVIAHFKALCREEFRREGEMWRVEKAGPAFRRSMQICQECGKEHPGGVPGPCECGSWRFISQNDRLAPEEKPIDWNKWLMKERGYRP